MESIARPTNRSFLEVLLKELTGSDWTLKLSLDANLSPAPKREKPTAPATKPESPETFKDDPLIKQALEIFKGEIKSVTS